MCFTGAASKGPTGISGASTSRHACCATHTASHGHVSELFSAASMLLVDVSATRPASQGYARYQWSWDKHSQLHPQSFSLLVVCILHTADAHALSYDEPIDSELSRFFTLACSLCCAHNLTLRLSNYATAS